MSADQPYHDAAIQALQQDGALLIYTNLGWFVEARTGLKALKLPQRGEVKRRLAQCMTPYAAATDGVNRLELIPYADLAQADPSMGFVAHAASLVPARFYGWPEWSVQLLVLSDHPAAVAWTRWLCDDFLPAMRRHGHYDPATNHEPPPSRLLDALELRERGRDVFNTIAPGLGEWGWPDDEHHR